MSDDDATSTREVEALLRLELDNWIRYGRQRDWMPPSFTCPLGFMYQPVLGDVHEDQPRLRLRVDEAEALAFEGVVIALPPKLRRAFVMYHLDRAHVHGHIRIVKGRNRQAQILGVTTRTYHRMVQNAHHIVLAAWRRLQADE